MKVLDKEDVDFMMALEEERQQRAKEVQQEEEDHLLKFRFAKEKAQLGRPLSVQKPLKESSKPVVKHETIVTAKHLSQKQILHRIRPKTTVAAKPGANDAAASVKFKPEHVVDAKDKAEKETVVETKAPSKNKITALLAQYGSDTDSS